MCVHMYMSMSTYACFGVRVKSEDSARWLGRPHLLPYLGQGFSFGPDCIYQATWLLVFCGLSLCLPTAAAQGSVRHSKHVTTERHLQHWSYFFSLG